MNAKKTTLPFIIMVIGTLLMIGSFFLSYTTAKPSLFEFFNTYRVEAGNKANERDVRLICIICTVIIGAIAFFGFFVLLCTLLRAPIATIVFTVLEFAANSVLSWDFKERRVVGSSYSFSIGYYLLEISLIVIFAASIWLLVLKIKNKKALNISESSV